ncbi:MAG: rhomboid family protein [Verrucomicrobiales bacterium]|nr:rhomboid family protein [Verrucomicrobiales bacterium]
MADVLSKTSCSIHVDRPATARCPSCGSFFCSECITEHEGRLTCAVCLNQERENIQEVKKPRRIYFMPFVQFGVAVVVAWLVYYFLAQFLQDMPVEFHDGTMWE